MSLAGQCVPLRLQNFTLISMGVWKWQYRHVASWQPHLEDMITFLHASLFSSLPRPLGWSVSHFNKSSLSTISIPVVNLYIAIKSPLSCLFSSVGRLVWVHLVFLYMNNFSKLVPNFVAALCILSNPFVHCLVEGQCTTAAHSPPGLMLTIIFSSITSSAVSSKATRILLTKLCLSGDSFYRFLWWWYKLSFHVIPKIFFVFLFFSYELIPRLTSTPCSLFCFHRCWTPEHRSDIQTPDYISLLQLNPHIQAKPLQRSTVSLVFYSR